MGAKHSSGLAGSNNVIVVVGAPQAVVVRADSNLISHVTTKAVAGSLIVADSGNYTARTPMTVVVSVPSLTALTLRGSGQLTVTVSGSGLLNAAGAAARLDAEVPGTGAIVYSGNPSRVTSSVTGIGTVTPRMSRLSARLAGHYDQ